MRLNAGATVPPRTLTTIAGDSVAVPDPKGLVHLQLRRFAGCPVCNLHLQEVIQRNDEISKAGIREVVVFHSSVGELKRYQADMPFAVIADPEKKIYAEFGVETSPRAVLDPRAWPAIFLGVARAVGRTIARKQPPPPITPENGSFGLPGDFLIAGDGRLVASKYGTYAYDQWSVDEMLALAAKRGSI